MSNRQPKVDVRFFVFRFTAWGLVDWSITLAPESQVMHHARWALVAFVLVTLWKLDHLILDSLADTDQSDFCRQLLKFAGRAIACYLLYRLIVIVEHMLTK